MTRHDNQIARGKHILLSGRALEQGGKPTVNTIVEIWQPDAGGVFRHPLDPRSSQADPGFFGWGRARTDAQGVYSFRTVLPGPYENRCSHLNLMLLAIGLTRRLVTTVFFSDHPSNVSDPVLDCVPNSASRLRLFAQRDPATDADGALGYRFDLLLRGENETPFFLD